MTKCYTCSETAEEECTSCDCYYCSNCMTDLTCDDCLLGDME